MIPKMKGTGYDWQGSQRLPLNAGGMVKVGRLTWSAFGEPADVKRSC